MLLGLRVGFGDGNAYLGWVGDMHRVDPPDIPTPSWSIVYQCVSGMYHVHSPLFFRLESDFAKELHRAK